MENKETEKQEGGRKVEVELTTIDEKIDFILSSGKRLATRLPEEEDLASPGYEAADVIFDGDLHEGEVTSDIIEKIKNKFGVDLESEPDFTTTGDREYQVWKIPPSEGFYLLADEAGLLAYEWTVLEEWKNFGMFDYPETLTE